MVAVRACIDRSSSLDRRTSLSTPHQRAMILRAIADGLRDEKGTMRQVSRAPVSRVLAALAGALAIPRSDQEGGD